MNAKVREMENLFVSLKSLDRNINGIGLGKRIKSGVTTREEAIVVYVNKKLPLSAVPTEKRIFNELTFDKKVYKTDVVQSVASHADVKFEFGTNCNGSQANSYGLPPVSSNLYRHRARLDILSGGCSFTNWSPGELPTFSTLGGIFRDKTDNSYVGLTNRHSIDKFFKINLSYINRFTNVQEFTGFEWFRMPFLNHYSLAQYGKEFFINNDNYPDYKIKTLNFQDVLYNYTISNSYAYQPSRYVDNDGVPAIDAPSGSNCFGFVKRAAPALIYDESKLIKFNYVDGAVIGITDRVNSTSKNQLNFYWTLNKSNAIATDEEIDFIFRYSRPLFYSGGRSGPMGREGGAGPFTCTLRPIVNYRVVEIGSAVYNDIDDIKKDEGITYIYSDCMEYESVIYDWRGAPPVTCDNYCTDPALPPGVSWFPCITLEWCIPGDPPNLVYRPALMNGDSGSLVWGLLSSTPTNIGGWKIIGLNFATTHNEIQPNTIIRSTGIFCRITNVLRDLNLQVWNGETLNFSKNSMTDVVLKEVDFTKLNENVEDELVKYIEIEGEKYYYSGSKYTKNYNDVKYNT